jgi:uncharacterized protein YprB with RNaseH-like and TPR domain
MDEGVQTRPALEAYLDIETTGFFPGANHITVVGIYITNGTEDRVVQLVNPNISDEAILRALEGVSTLYTYNGKRFDLPFINSCHGVNLETEFQHCDLMFYCWRNRLYGGLKKVEQRLGIARQDKEVNGLEAVRLWWQYVNNYDQKALKRLLDYNKEDVVNLKVLRDKLLGPSR